MKSERGIIGWIILIIGVALVLFTIGFFDSKPSFWGAVNYKKMLNLPCGITVNAPSKNDKVTFPITVSGYINGCGWAPHVGSAGLVQVLDAQGLPLTASQPMSVPADSTDAPFYFETILKLKTPPTTDTGTILFSSTNNLEYVVPVTF